MEREGSLPHSQVPTSCSYPEPARSIYTPTSHFLKIHLNIILHLRLDLPCDSFPQASAPKPCIRLSSPSYALHPPARLILLDLITRTILGEEYRSLSFLLCSFLHSPVSSSVLILSFLIATWKTKDSVITSYLAELSLSKYAICASFFSAPDVITAVPRINVTLVTQKRLYFPM